MSERRGEAKAKKKKDNLTDKEPCKEVVRNTGKLADLLRRKTGFPLFIHKRLINIPNAWAYVLNRHIIHFCNLPQNLFARFTSRIKTN